MKYIRWFSKIILFGLFYAMIGLILQHTVGMELSPIFGAVLGGLAVLAFWED